MIGPSSSDCFSLAMVARWALLLGVVLLGTTAGARAQDSTAAAADTTQPWYAGAWKRIVERGGVGIAYVFYGEADNENNGVVLRLNNRNDYAVRYEFTVLFRGPEGAASARTEGTLAPGQMKTGENDNLFWIPFEDGRRISRVGLRGIDVEPLSDPGG